MLISESKIITARVSFSNKRKESVMKRFVFVLAMALSFLPLTAQAAIVDLPDAGQRHFLGKTYSRIIKSAVFT